ncbi:helix-turn-helix domain-containing protein [Rhodobacteraceae bacterium NNCM2]|nr:helix-turn-helix domain-containing protein [Coraliihabitans acroporae]
MELRGFDTYEITLGDEMRGERASMGKSLEDVERDLRIKGYMITAIENCDLEGFPNPSVVAGYVRSYARYLGLDADSCYQRFCNESGFQSPVAMYGKGPESSGDRDHACGLNSAAGSQLAKSRFAAPPMPTRFAPNISFGGVFSSLALVTTLGGLSYGGYAVLQDIQRVGFAPLVEAPDIVSEAPAIAVPNVDPGFTAPDASAYLGSGALAGIEVPAEFPVDVTGRRDGPISDIDPLKYGVFAQPEEELAPVEKLAVIDSADDAILAAEAEQEANSAALASGLDLNDPRSNDLAFSPVASKGITVHAAEVAWVRVSESENVILFEGTLDVGQTYDLPESVKEPVIRAGNAGGVYVVLDGVAYGPIGARGRVVKNLPLTADAIKERFPRAESLATGVEAAPENQQQAAVDLN